MLRYSTRAGLRVCFWRRSMTRTRLRLAFSRKRPLNDSLSALSVRLPGLEQAISTPFS
jgi:hypothetical protein